MNIKKALELLDLEEDASKQEIRKAYQELYNDMQIRITNVPDSLRQKYLERLKQIDEAYQVLGGTLEDDISDLPNTEPVEEEVNIVHSSPSEVTISSAKELLGVQGEYFQEDLENFYQERKAELEAAMQQTPLKNIKKAYESTLKELDQSYELLKPNAKVRPQKKEEKSKITELKQAYEALGIPFGTENHEVVKAYHEKRKELVYIISNRKDDFAKAASEELTILEKNISFIIPNIADRDKYPEKVQAKTTEKKPVNKPKNKSLVPVILGILGLILVVAVFLFWRKDESTVKPIETATAAVTDNDLILGDTIAEIISEEPITTEPSPAPITQTEVSPNPSSNNTNRNQIMAQAIQAYNDVNFKKAIDLFQQAAQQNVAEAYTMLGLTYYWGHGWGGANFQKAKENFEKAISLGDDTGNYGMGLLYQNGRGVNKNTGRAQDYFKAAISTVKEKSNQGNHFWTERLASMTGNGFGTTRNSGEQMRLLRIAVANEITHAYYNLGVNYQNGENGLQQNYTEALRLYRLAASKGHPWAQNTIGVIYEFGSGVTKNEAEAVKWYRMAAEQGYDEAQYRLGSMYEFGTGISKNESEAFSWYKKSAAQNNDWGLFNLARMYYLGRGTTQNFELAYQHFKQAADKGHTGAMSYLGAMYDYGYYLQTDWEKAFEFYKKGETSGSFLRQLGEMYFFGVGGAPKNEALAMEYFKKSNDNWSKVYLEVIPKLGKQQYFEASNSRGDKISLTSTFSSPVVMGKLGNSWTEKVYLSFNAASRSRVWPVGNAYSGGESPKDEILYSNYSSSEEFTSNTEKQVSVSSKTPRRTIGYYYITATFNTGDVQLKIPVAFAWKPE